MMTLALRGLRHSPLTDRREREGPEVRTWILLATGVVVGAAALGFQLLALQHAWVGFVDTVKRGIGSALALVFGRVFFAEPLTLRKVLAVGAIVAGVTVMLW